MILSFIYRGIAVIYTHKNFIKFGSEVLIWNRLYVFDITNKKMSDKYPNVTHHLPQTPEPFRLYLILSRTH